MRVLITGISGFVGQHLAAWLEQADYEVWGISRTPPPALSADRFYPVDLSSNIEFADLIRQVMPTQVFHMAGLYGEAAYTKLYQVNVLGTILLFESLLAADCTPRVVIASTSGVYGPTTPAENPLNEEQMLRPLSHYAASKVAQEMVGLQYFQAYEIPVIRVRTFNLVGPGMSPALLASSLARQIALLERTGRDGVIQMGNLWPRRDYVDVRDAVQAYVALAEMGTPAEVYHICSGSSYAGQDCLDILLELAQVSVRIEQDPHRMRTAEIPDQIGDAARLQRLTGWRPKIDLETSLADLLDSWRTAVAREDKL